MNQNKREKGGGCMAFAIVGLLILPPLYVLSIGPAVWLATRGWVPRWALAIYAPLEIAASIWPIIGDLLEKYAAAWRA